LVERKLIRAAQHGSEQALAELYSAHWARAHRAAYLVVHDAAAAEDIAQDAFLAAVDALDRFDRRRPFGPWLHRIVINRAIDWGRREALRRKVAEPDSQIGAEGPAEAVGGDLIEALAQLPAEQRRGRAQAPARLHPRRDREDARPAAGNGQLPPAALA